MRGIGREKIQAKGIDNLVNRIIADHFPNFKREACPGAG
jgi:hypothetical protein